jgi:hypothetical protein
MTRILRPAGVGPESAVHRSGINGRPTCTAARTGSATCDRAQERGTTFTAVRRLAPAPPTACVSAPARADGPVRSVLFARARAHGMERRPADAARAATRPCSGRWSADHRPAGPDRPNGYHPGEKPGRPSTGARHRATIVGSGTGWSVARSPACVARAGGWTGALYPSHF